MLKSLIICAAMMLALAGCSSPQVKLTRWARTNGSVPEVIQSAHFPIQTLTPAHFKPRNRLTFYIEGDGHAWATISQPSLDPSPHAFTVAALATRDHPGIYMARPCQFVMSQACTPSVWSNARFGSNVIESISAAIDVLKGRYGATSIELIGYSGGATVALLLAEQRNDVSQLQTIAGNLAPAKWVRHHGLSPLTGSLEPSLDAAHVRNIAQRHFIGSDDDIIEPVLTLDHLKDKAFRCMQLVALPGDHVTVLEAFDSRLLEKPIVCD